MGAHGTNGQKLFKFNCYGKLYKLKLTAFPYLSPRTLGEGLKKKKKKKETKFVKKHCTLDQQNKFEQHSTHLEQNDDLNTIISTTQGSMHIFSFAKVIVCQLERNNLYYQHFVPESQYVLDCR